MKRRSHGAAGLGRREWLLTSLAGLAACGGGGSGSVGALPGTGGTGIGVQGPITGFGSVIVNNIRFDDSTATVLLDGQAWSTADLRIGMVASIQGTRNAGGASGTASRIEAWSIGQGVVTPSAIAGSSFTLLGMTIQTDAATAFEGLANLAAIRTDTCLTVWGLQLSADARTWKATRVARLPATPPTVACTGAFDAVAMALNGLAVAGPALSGFGNQQLIRVEGVLNGSHSLLQASRVVAMGARTLASDDAELELEGIVTAVLGGNQFSMGTVQVDASRAQLTPSGQSLGLNSLVEVEGVMRSGVLVASHIEIQTQAGLRQLDITGSIETFQSLADFVLRGQRCNAAQARVLSGSSGDLRRGAKVRVLGTSNGQEVLSVASLYVYAD